MLTHRERVLRAFRFESIDRVPYDLMESSVWPELLDYFRRTRGCTNEDEVRDYLDPDFRWAFMSYKGPVFGPAELVTASDADLLAVVTREATTGLDYSRLPGGGITEDWLKTYSDGLYRRPLAGARTVADVAAYPWPDPAWWQAGDYAAARERFPDHALVFCPGWLPLFCGACNAFGMEETLVNMLWEPQLVEAFIRRQHEMYLDILSRGLDAAQGYCDICWLGDDYASQEAMLMNPDLWRKFVKSYLAEQVRLAREHGMYVLFHSCGAVRPILSDLIEIGVNALLVFQVTARGMDARSIAAEFGGKLAFYGGIDCQRVLTFGTPEEVHAAVCANVEAFAPYGGYIVANCHHGIANIRGENIEAMCEAARSCVFHR